MDGSALCPLPWLGAATGAERVSYPVGWRCKRRPSGRVRRSYASLEPFRWAGKGKSQDRRHNERALSRSRPSRLRRRGAPAACAIWGWCWPSPRDGCARRRRSSEGGAQLSLAIMWPRSAAGRSLRAFHPLALNDHPGETFCRHAIHALFRGQAGCGAASILFGCSVGRPSCRRRPDLLPACGTPQPVRQRRKSRRKRFHVRREKYVRDKDKTKCLRGSDTLIACRVTGSSPSTRFRQRRKSGARGRCRGPSGPEVGQPKFHPQQGCGSLHRSSPSNRSGPQTGC